MSWQGGGVTNDRRDLPADLEAEMARRTPYGLHPEAKTGALTELSEAAADAARNLLDKAASRLARGQDDRADRLIARVVAMPYDEHWGCWHGTAMAGQLLFDALSTIAEEWAEAQESPEDYESVYWLHEDMKRAVDVMDPDNLAVLRETLETIVADATLLGISPRESRGLAAAAERMPAPSMPKSGWTVPPDASEMRREEMIRIYLDVLVDVMRVIDTSGGPQDSK